MLESGVNGLGLLDYWKNTTLLMLHQSLLKSICVISVKIRASSETGRNTY